MLPLDTLPGRADGNAVRATQAAFSTAFVHADVERSGNLGVDDVEARQRP
jgi:hypothetical protein